MEKLTRDTFLAYLRNTSYGSDPGSYGSKRLTEDSIYCQSIHNFRSSLAENTWPLMERRSDADLK